MTTGAPATDRKIPRVLAVSPRFAPTNGADTHRLRLLLAHAAAGGWAAEVLAVDPADAGGPVDPWLVENLPAHLMVHRVRAWRIRGWGLDGLAQRSAVPLYRTGCELLGTGRFDLVFFSTTEFALHLLGPLWQRRCGVPFCMDYQDPWVNDYYARHPEAPPPGGRVKHALASSIHRLLERRVAAACSGFLAVSQAYLDGLERRYGAGIAKKPQLVRPFPAEPAELDGARSEPAAAKAEGAPLVWRYIGRGGADLEKAAAAFFLAWGRAVAGGALARQAVRLEAHGTSYAASGSGGKTFEPLAAAAGLAGLVSENPERLGYRDVLRRLVGSDALLVFGSDDPGYTASKIHPCLLAGRPLLAVFHEDSPVVRLMRAVGGGVCVTFTERTTREELAAAIGRAWFAQGRFGRAVALDRAAFEPHTAGVQALEVGAWFGRVLSRD